jgi:Ca-activated chloride channel family protein
MVRRLQVVAVVMFVWALSGVVPSGQSSPAALQRSGVAIVGSVVDATLAPIAGVSITLEQGGRVQATTTTDAAGTFRFTAVAPGNYRVRAEHSGFPAFARDVRVPSGVTTVQLPIVLTRAGDDLPAAKTTETRAIESAVTGVPGASAAPAAQLQFPAAGPAGVGGGRAGAFSGRGAAMDQPTVTGEAPIFVPNGDRPFFPPLEGPWSGYRYPHSGESYAHVEPNRFQSVGHQPLSTFGADVDTASYSNVRRFLSSGQLPPRDAVRVEELVNYFRFPYDEPRDNRPLRVTTEVGDCPWAPSHKLVLIGARAKASAPREIEGRNIVLLVDVSGSMAPPERLPLIKTALGMFVDTLRPDDRLAIVTYAGSSGLALPSTPARQRDVIQRTIAGLSAGGSTNGGQGLIMAYRVAREAFVPGGVNRVILATDGDFNVGIVRQDDLVHLIEREKNSGVFLSVLGVGTGNLKDSTMEMLADKGNGHYAYLDSLQEARRVLLREADATLEAVAKDVKFQVEFNPAMVAAWKLVGYEDRLLAAQDFNDDRKDGGEMGAGHTVTVLYEVIPAGVENPDDARTPGRPAVDPLKYQPAPQVLRPATPARVDAGHANEWLTVKVRYKAPEGDESDLIVQAVGQAVGQPVGQAVTGGRTRHLPLASAVAEFGLLLRDGSRDAAQWDALVQRVERLEVPASLNSDKDAFKELVEMARGLVRLRMR